VQPFYILQPDSIPEASSFLLKHENSRIVAGGTALVIVMKKGLNGHPAGFHIEDHEMLLPALRNHSKSRDRLRPR